MLCKYHAHALRMCVAVARCVRSNMQKGTLMDQSFVLCNFVYSTLYISRVLLLPVFFGEFFCYVYFYSFVCFSKILHVHLFQVQADAVRAAIRSTTSAVKQYSPKILEQECNLIRGRFQAAGPRIEVVGALIEFGG